MKVSDFRSDTVTKPDGEMRQAMAEAEVGDDVFGDDPTVNRLEALAASLFEREAALFVPSGTMANQICVFLHTGPGDEIILEKKSHIYNYEVGALSVISRVQAHPLAGEDGQIPIDDIKRAIRPPNIHLPRTSLIALENTHNAAGGRILPLPYLEEVSQLARRHSTAFHLDGARIFNAACASQTPLTSYGQMADSLSFCLSKGLGAPAGSLIVGDETFIQEGRRVRKMLGGGMRQAGILAAAGILALERREELKKDHQLARDLAEKLASFPSLQLDFEKVETNILIVDLLGGLKADSFLADLEARGVRAVAFSPTRIRFVTHRDLGPEDVKRAVMATREILTSPKSL